MPAALSSRSDARRNRERIVAVARDLFGTHGVDVSVREVAAAANIGLGTLYRHFPTRDELIDAAVAEAFEECVAVAEIALTAESAWEGFAGFLEQSLALHARNRAFVDVTEERGGTRTAAVRKRLRVLLKQLIARAQAEGSLRADFQPRDATVIFWACDRTIELGDEKLWRRQLGFILDGLKVAA